MGRIRSGRFSAQHSEDLDGVIVSIGDYPTWATTVLTWEELAEARNVLDDLLDESKPKAVAA
jgi:hypothetical protein